MEVQRTTTEGKSEVTDSIKLTYSISTKGEKKDILGEVRKDDEIVGRFNACLLYTSPSPRDTR